MELKVLFSPDTTISVNPTQLRNARVSIEVTLFEIKMDDNPIQ